MFKISRKILISMSREEPRPVKVKIIETQFIETDTANFKSTVQCLTGKESAETGTALAATLQGSREDSLLQKEEKSEIKLKVDPPKFNMFATDK
jgi:VQ motif